MSEVYVGNLFADEPLKNIYQQKCDKYNIYSIGWAVKEHPKNFEEYCKAAKKTKYKKGDKYVAGEEIRGLKSTIKTIAKLKKGDFIWTRNPEKGEYWLGRVTKNIQDIGVEDFYQIYKIDQETDSSDDFCLSIPCEKWKKFKLDEVPGNIINSFMGHVIAHSSASEKIFSYCKSIYDNEQYPTISVEDFKYLLHPDDEEDLLGLYLQKEKNYYIYPSTNKLATAAFEYELIQKDTLKKAIIQCKMSDTNIDLNSLLSYGYDIYCTTDKGNILYNDKIYKKGDITNIKVEILPLDFLITWAAKPENICILPNRLQRYIKMIK